MTQCVAPAATQNSPPPGDQPVTPMLAPAPAPALAPAPAVPSPSAASPPLADFKVGVDNVIFAIDLTAKRLLVLLVQRSHDPFTGQWSLPGTLVRQGESLEAAAYRTLAEKIHVQNLYLEQLYTFGGPGRDPREDHASFGVRYLSVSYFALVRHGEAQFIHPDSAVETSHPPNSTGALAHPPPQDPPPPAIAWHPFTHLPPLAFDHDRITQYGYQRLRNKLEYSPIAFEVLPEQFTLNELYQFYGIVLGEQFADYSNFRARLLKLGFLCDTGIKTSRGAGRPASLYRFDATAFEPLKDKPLVFV